MGFNFYANILEEANVKVNPDPVDDIDIEVDTSVLDAQKKYIADKKAKADKRSEGQGGEIHNGFLVGIAYKQAYWEIGSFLGKQVLDKVKNQMETLKDDELMAEKKWEDMRKMVLDKDGFIGKKLEKIKQNKEDPAVMTKDKLQLYQMWRLYFLTKKDLLTKVAMSKTNRINYLAGMLEKAVNKRPEGDYSRTNFKLAAPNNIAGELSKEGQKTVEKYNLHDADKLQKFIGGVQKDNANWEQGADMDLTPDQVEEYQKAAYILESYYERMATVFYDHADIDMNEDRQEWGYPSWSIISKNSIIKYLTEGNVLTLFQYFAKRVMMMNEANGVNIDKVVKVIEEAIKAKKILVDTNDWGRNQTKIDKEKKGENTLITNRKRKVDGASIMGQDRSVLDDDEDYYIIESLFQRLS